MLKISREEGSPRKSFYKLNHITIQLCMCLRKIYERELNNVFILVYLVNVISEKLCSSLNPSVLFWIICLLLFVCLYWAYGQASKPTNKPKHNMSVPVYGYIKILTVYVQWVKIRYVESILLND